MRPSTTTQNGDTSLFREVLLLYNSRSKIFSFYLIRVINFFLSAYSKIMISIFWIALTIKIAFFEPDLLLIIDGLITLGGSEFQVPRILDDELQTYRIILLIQWLLELILSLFAKCLHSCAKVLVKSYRKFLCEGKWTCIRKIFYCGIAIIT